MISNNYTYRRYEYNSNYSIQIFHVSFGCSAAVARAGHRVPVLEEERGWTQVTGRSHQQAVVDQRAAAKEGEEEKSITEKEKTREKKLLLLYLRDRSLATSDSFSSQVQTIGGWPRGLV